MGNEKICCHCGKRIGLLENGIKLSDETRLCAECTSMIPRGYDDFVKKHWQYQNYLDFLEYSEYSDYELQRIFNPTERYSYLYIDETHGLFCISNGAFGKILPNDIIYRMDSVRDFKLKYNMRVIQKTFLSGYQACGDTEFLFSIAYPFITISGVLEYDVKTNAHKKFLSNDFIIDPLENFELFTHSFEKTYSLFMSQYFEEEGDNEAEESGHSQEPPIIQADDKLQKALGLFMLDSLEGITVNDLKKQRNRLIKAFHPDADSTVSVVSSQKINDAYDILVSYIGE